VAKREVRLKNNNSNNNSDERITGCSNVLDEKKNELTNDLAQQHDKETLARATRRKRDMLLVSQKKLSRRYALMMPEDEAVKAMDQMV
jgi:hypothetical protein